MFWMRYEQVPVEKLLASAREACPGLEYGRVVAKRDVVYARWRNGPDLYEVYAPADWREASRVVLSRTLTVWARIAKKSKDSAPRVPLDVKVFWATVVPKERCSLHHAIEALWDGSDPTIDKKWHDFLAANPEVHEDLCRSTD